MNYYVFFITEDGERNAVVCDTPKQVDEVFVNVHLYGVYHRVITTRKPKDTRLIPYNSTIGEIFHRDYRISYNKKYPKVLPIELEEEYIHLLKHTDIFERLKKVTSSYKAYKECEYLASSIISTKFKRNRRDYRRIIAVRLFDKHEASL